MPRRIREQRSVYSRVPDPGSFRTNDPDGFLTTFDPIPVPGNAGDIDGMDGAWWRGSDSTWGGPTKGSHLTDPHRSRQGMTAYQVRTAVQRCLDIIVGPVVRTLWLYRGPDGEQIPRPLWVDDPMMVGRVPGPATAPLQPVGRRMEGQAFYGTFLSHAILWGRGAFVFVEAADLTPLPGSLMLLNPYMVDVDDDGYIVLDPFGAEPLTTDFDGRFEMGGSTWRVVLMHGPWPNDPTGPPSGVLQRNFDQLRIGARLGRYVGSMFRTGVPSGYLSVATPKFGREQEPDPDDPKRLINEADALRKRWMRQHGEDERSVAVLNSMVTYTPLAMNPVSADVAKLISVNRTDIAHAFGLSSVFLDEGISGMAYSNASERRADLVALTDASWGERLTNVISSLLPFGTTAQVNWPQFIAPSIETLAPVVNESVREGTMTAMEGRAYIGITPWTIPDPAFRDRSLAAATDESTLEVSS